MSPPDIWPGVHKLLTGLEKVDEEDAADLGYESIPNVRRSEELVPRSWFQLLGGLPYPFIKEIVVSLLRLVLNFLPTLTLSPHAE